MVLRQSLGREAQRWASRVCGKDQGPGLGNKSGEQGLSPARIRTGSSSVCDAVGWGATLSTSRSGHQALSTSFKGHALRVRGSDGAWF